MNLKVQKALADFDREESLETIKSNLNRLDVLHERLMAILAVLAKITEPGETK